jgi:hypothetical protein
MCHEVKSNVLASNLYFTMENKTYNHKKSSTFYEYELFKIRSSKSWSGSDSVNMNPQTLVLPQKKVLAS